MHTRACLEAQTIAARKLCDCEGYTLPDSLMPPLYASRPWLSHFVPHERRHRQESTRASRLAGAPSWLGKEVASLPLWISAARARGYGWLGRLGRAGEHRRLTAVIAWARHGRAGKSYPGEVCPGWTSGQSQKSVNIASIQDRDHRGQLWREVTKSRLP